MVPAFAECFELIPEQINDILDGHAFGGLVWAGWQMELGDLCEPSMRSRQSSLTSGITQMAQPAIE